MTPEKPSRPPADRAVCQHCPKPIRRRPSGYWLDEEGSWYCMRIDGRALAHTPMPVIGKAS